MDKVPSVRRQIAFIIENASILNRATQMHIMTLVMTEIGPAVVTGTPREVDIDLDAVAAVSEGVINHIYNMVSARLDALNQPARDAGLRR